MSSSDTTPSPGDRLANVRREKFAQLLCGRHWGRAATAYAEAGFKCSSPETAASCASRLLTDVKVQRRVERLRQQALDQLGADRVWILGHRKKIVENPDSSPEAVLMALRDIERAQGLGQPEKIEVELSGRTEHAVLTVGNDAVAGLWTFIEDVKRDFAASRAATPQQIEERRLRLASQGKLLPTGDGQPEPVRKALPGATPAPPASKPSPQLSPAAREQLRKTVVAVPLAQGGAASPTAR